MIPAAIRAGTIVDWLPDRSGFMVALAVDEGAGVVCPHCPENGAMAFCVVRQRITADGRLSAEYVCLRCDGADELVAAA